MPLASMRLTGPHSAPPHPSGWEWVLRERNLVIRSGRSASGVLRNSPGSTSADPKTASAEDMPVASLEAGPGPVKTDGRPLDPVA
jgi:hypothetical protein